MMAFSFDPEWAAAADWAKLYRSMNLNVVPAFVSGDGKKKHPVGGWKEFQHALVPQALFDRWYGSNGEHTSSNTMGFLTGPASLEDGWAILVIDVDVKAAARGNETWAAWLAEYNNGIEFETWQAVTGSGGRHFYFKYPSTLKIFNTQGSFRGIDTRAEGGFIMAPPSPHYIKNKSYEWIDGASPWEIEIEAAPDWLIDIAIEIGNEGAGQSREKAPSPEGQKNDFGLNVNNRESEMRDMVWARLIDLKRKGIEPTEAEASRCFELYERNNKTRLANVQTNAEGLEREGRGWTEFKAKWRRVCKLKWEHEIAEEAAKEPALQEHPAQALTPQPGRFSFEKIGDLRQFPPTNWMVDKWIPERSIGILYGKWGAGKSFVSFDLGLHLAYGLGEWHGVKLPDEPVEVLVIAREGHAGFVKRIDAFKQHYGLVDDAEPFTFMRGSVSFMNQQDFADLCEAIKTNGTKFGLVIVDTVARVTAGEDTNEQKVATLFMERCQAIGELTGATTIGVHHQNKSGGMMGSIYFEANADFVFEVSREGEDGPLESGEIRCTKQKDGEDGWKLPVSFKKIVTSQITQEGSLVVFNIGGSVTAKPVAGLPDKDTCKRILNAVHEAWSKGVPWHPHPNTEKLGRYAIRNICREFGASRTQAENLIQEWQKNGVLMVQTANSDTKLKGLKVLQWL